MYSRLSPITTSSESSNLGVWTDFGMDWYVETEASGRPLMLMLYGPWHPCFHFFEADGRNCDGQQSEIAYEDSRTQIAQSLHFNPTTDRVRRRRRQMETVRFQKLCQTIGRILWISFSLKQEGSNRPVR